MRVVLLLHGIKDPNANGLKRLKGALEDAGWFVRTVHYGLFFARGFFMWGLFNKPIAYVLAGFTEILHTLGNEVVLVAHSNGAAIAAEASRQGACLKLLIFINGACDRDIVLGGRTERFINYRMKSDPVLALAWLPGLVGHPWADWNGSMGNLGPKDFKDDRVWDVDLEEQFGIRFKHAGFFSEANAPRMGAELVKAIRWGCCDTE